MRAHTQEVYEYMDKIEAMKKENKTVPKEPLPDELRARHGRGGRSRSTVLYTHTHTHTHIHKIRCFKETIPLYTALVPYMISYLYKGFIHSIQRLPNIPR